MIISKIDTIPLAIPFDTGAPKADFLKADWNKLNVLLVRVETDDGLVGFGEAFSYNCMGAVKAAVDEMVAPVVLGKSAANIAGLMHDLHHAMHLFGRYGITMFAISGLDIALWDLAGKAAGLPLHRLLGGKVRDSIPAYASLFRYGVPEVVADNCAKAKAQGYEYVKLHETREPEVAIARETLGDTIPLMIDTNCPWTPVQALANALVLKPYGIHWLEEPIFPPEDFGALARLQADSGVRIAAGENACTAYEFDKMFEAGAVSFAQPSVTKVGGVSEMMKIATLAAARGVSFMPHSPYFGPGFMATLQIAAAHPTETLVERFFMDLDGSLFGDWLNPVNGAFAVPDGPGLGMDPDPDVVREFAV